MSVLLMGAFTSLGLGTLTVIHPCPLSTNIAAVSFLYGWKQHYKNKILTALLFVLGEIITFAVLGIFISHGVLNIPIAANFFQIYMRQLLGPILIIVGMILSGILLPRQYTIRISAHFLQGLAKFGILGGFVLGILIALSFCPMSAAIFFGVLIPLAVSSNTAVLYPVFFGIGSSIPLLLTVIVISQSAVLFDRSFLIKKSVEKKLREFAGIAMILMGIFMSLCYIFKVL